MPRFRVTIVQRRLFIDDIEAPSPPEAATALGDRIRGGTTEPVVSSLTDVDVFTYLPAEDVPGASGLNEPVE